MIKITILVPVYNEEKTIVEILEKVRGQQIEGVELEIVVVDDGSSDQTVRILEANSELYDQLITRKTNGGKGAAVRDGLLAASGDFVLFQDADLEYDPNDYEKLMRPVLDCNADVVIGSRLTAPAMTRVYYFWHKIGNHLLTLAFNLLNNTTFSDIYSCYLLFRRDLIDPDALITNGWDQQAEILTRAVQRGHVFYEVPISYFGRTYGEGKKIRSYHAAGVAWTILRSRFSTQRQTPS